MDASRARKLTSARANRLPTWFRVAVAAPPAVFLTLFYVWPFATLVVRGLSGPDALDVLSRQRTWEVLWFTTWQAAASTALTVLVGLAPAWATARYEFPGRRLLLSTLTAVFVLPTVVIGAAMIAVLPADLERSVWAILAAHVVFNLAVVVRTVGTTWAVIPTDLEHAARTLGATPWRTFRLVTLPVLMPAIAAAASIVFLFTFTSFGVVRVLGGARHATLEVEVWRRATQLGDIAGASTLALLQLLALAAVVMWGSAVQRRTATTLDGHADRRTRPTGRLRWQVGSAAALCALIVAVPLLALVERSFWQGDRYSLAGWRSLGNNEIRPGLQLGIDPLGALWRSITTAAWATVFALCIGTVAVIAISTLGRRSGKVLDTGLMLPLGTSAVTIGFGMLITFDRDPVDWRSSWWLVPVGHALVATPFVVRNSMAVVRSQPIDQRHAAATLGAAPLRAWASTTLPALRRPLATGAGLAAAISLGEFGATSFLSRSGAETLPIAIDRLLGRTGRLFQAQAFALSTILAVATIVLVVAIDAGGDRARRS
ncbi:MAG TPA: iron ABC transporter permease [Ilumatobacter sp.]|nr:iron ABC transporter permease [Ilumatobacter sp.]